MARIWKILLFAFFVFFSQPLQVYASEERIQLEVSYGLSKEEARYGRVCVFTIDIMNLQEAVEGTVQLTLASGRLQGGVRYEQSFSLVKGERKELCFQIKTDFDFTGYQILILSSEKEILAEYENSFQIKHYGSLMQLGVLGSSQEKVKYLEDFGNNVLQLDENSLSNKENGLDTLDILFINSSDDSKYSQKQIQSVNQWIEAGGLLVLGAGTKFGEYENRGKELTQKELTFGVEKEVFRSLREQVNRYEEERVSTLLDIEKRRKESGVLLPIYIGKTMLQDRMLSDMKSEPITKQIIELPQSETEICLREDTEILAVQKQVGKGKVLYLAFSLEMEESVWKAAQTWLTNFFMEQITETGKQKINSESYGYSNDYWTQDILDTARQEQIPSVTRYLLIFIIYLLVISPFIYWILSRMDRIQYLWGVVPILSLLFTFIVYEMGSSTRVEEPFYGYFNVEVFKVGEKTAQGTLNFYVELSNNQAHSFDLKNNKELTIKNRSPELSYYNILYSDPWFSNSLPTKYENYTNCINIQEEETTITLEKLPAFTKTNYQTSYTANYEEIPLGEVSVDDVSIEGNVTNLFSFNLEDAFIYSNHLCIDLGTIQSGETISFTSEQAFNIANDELVYAYQEVPLQEYKRLSAKKQRNILATKYALLDLLEQKGSYLIGFSEEITEKNPLAKTELKEGSYGTTLIIVPMEEQYISAEQQFVPIMDSYMEIIDGTLEKDSFRYIMTESLVVQYHLPKEEEVTKILLTQMLNQLPKTEDLSEMAGDIYFFNLTDRSYDFVFRCSWESLNSNEIKEISGEKLKKYINDSNEIQVKFVNTSMESNCILPYLSYYKKN